MEAGTIAPSAASTGSRTIADLLPLAAEKHADAVAVRQKVGDEWVDITYAEMGEIVSEIGRGLIDLGIEAGDRVAILCNTRPEWSYASLAISSAGAVVVPVYPTNSPEECEWVVGNSESVAVVCEDASQVAKIVAVRDQLPALRAIVVIDPEGDVADAVSLDDVRERGRGRDADELRARYEAVTGEDPFTFIYTSGTTGPAQGLRPLARQLPRRLQHVRDDRRARGGRGRLPVPAARARVRAAHRAARASTSARRSRTGPRTRRRSSPS